MHHTAYSIVCCEYSVTNFNVVEFILCCAILSQLSKFMKIPSGGGGGGRWIWLYVAIVTTPSFFLLFPDRIISLKNEWTIFHPALLRSTSDHFLKRHNQVKIIKKSVFLFWSLNMTTCCKHGHRLELQKFFLIFVLRIYQLKGHAHAKII